jgi:UMF1 family MFS transporter
MKIIKIYLIAGEASGDNIGAKLMKALRKENPNVEYQFYGVAAVVGLVMGGIQSMSRSTYSRLLPKDSMDNTTYFSFYDVLEKIAIILGTFIFAILIDNYDAIRLFFSKELTLELPTTSGMRFASLTMSIFFMLGLFFIRFLKFDTLKEKETL